MHRSFAGLWWLGRDLVPVQPPSTTKRLDVPYSSPWRKQLQAKADSQAMRFFPRSGLIPFRQLLFRFDIIRTLGMLQPY
jgi:hypothetical protein